MGDRYIDEADVFAVMEADVVRAVCASAGASLTRLIEISTSEIKAKLKNSNYTVPSPTAPAVYVVGSDVKEDTVKAAVLSGVRRQLSSYPSSSLPLPAEYDATPENQARVMILQSSRGGTLDLPQGTVNSPGAITFSSQTGLNAPRTSSLMMFGGSSSGSGWPSGWR